MKHLDLNTFDKEIISCVPQVGRYRTIIIRKVSKVVPEISYLGGAGYLLAVETRACKVGQILP